jgi:mannose-6-phosphate isomerase-like protein (cupin superfamily)
MDLIERHAVERVHLPGRTIQKVVGKDGVSFSEKMTMGFATYSEASGPMEPHHHAEEIIYVLSAENGWVRHGEAADQLGEPVILGAGTVLHFPQLEWHVFEYGPGGHIEILYFYGQVDNIRPEDIESDD